MCFTKTTNTKLKAPWVLIMPVLPVRGGGGGATDAWGSHSQHLPIPDHLPGSPLPCFYQRSRRELILLLQAQA